MHCRFHLFLSYLLHFHLSPKRDGDLESTRCSFSVQQLLEVYRPYPQQFLLSVISLPLLSLITAPLFTSLPSSVLYRAILNIICLPPSSSSFRYSSSSILLRALSTALLAAFFFWPYRCFKLVGSCSPLILMQSIIFHAFCFSPTAFATSSVHHPWFLLQGVPPFRDVLPNNSSATPTNTSLYCLHSPATVPLSASNSSYFLLTLSLYSTNKKIHFHHFHHLIFFGPIVLFYFHFFMRTSKANGLCCGVTYSPANALQSFILLSCCFRTTSRSSSVLCRPLLSAMLCLSFFWKNVPATANPFLLKTAGGFKS